MTTPISYPSTLPRPTKAQHQPKVRFSSTDLKAKLAFASRQLDYTGTVSVEFFLTREQVEVFHTWWKDTLVEGGLSFNATWPDMRPGEHVYTFASAPVYSHVYDGAYRASATLDVRGASQAVRNWGYCSISGPSWEYSSAPWAGATELEAVCAVGDTYLAAPASGGQLLRVTRQGAQVEVLSIPSQEWKRMVAAGSRVVAVASNNSSSQWSAYSDDLGDTWTAAANLPISSYWYGLGYGNGVLIATAYGTSTFARSTDGGQSWSSVNAGLSRFYRGAVYDEPTGRWVAIADSTNETRVSTDQGLTWGAGPTLPATSPMRIASANGVIIAVPSGNATQVNRSANGGVSWTAHSLPFAGFWSEPKFNGSIWVTLCHSANANAGKFAWSATGETWQEGALPGLYGANTLALLNNSFGAVDLINDVFIYGSCRAG